MKSLPRGPAGPGEVWPGASTDAGEFYRVPGLTSLPRQRPSLTPRSLGKCQNAPLEVSEPSESVKTRRWRFPRPRKASKHAAGGFRGLGKRQNTPLKVSEPSEGSKHAAEDFRGLGKGSPAGLKILDRYPANLAGVPDAPRPRKGQTSVWINNQRHEKSLIGAGVFR